MKKILIVEDTQENMDAAKAFFSTIKDFEFVYATNRKEAEDLLESVDAVITDRQIPYVSGENVNSYAEDLLSEMKEDLSDDFDRYALKFLQQRQGYALMAIAYSVNVPVIMASEHGILMALVVNAGEAVTDIGKSLHTVPP